MTGPGPRSVGEVIADVAKADPGLADEVRAALSAKRLRDDLADAESALREFARTGRDGIARALAVLLVEYDARAGRVLRAPAQEVSVAAVRGAPEGFEPPPRDAKGDVVLP